VHVFYYPRKKRCSYNRPWSILTDLRLTKCFPPSGFLTKAIGVFPNNDLSLYPQNDQIPYQRKSYVLKRVNYDRTKIYTRRIMTVYHLTSIHNHRTEGRREKGKGEKHHRIGKLPVMVGQATASGNEDRGSHMGSTSGPSRSPGAVPSPNTRLAAGRQ